MKIAVIVLTYNEEIHIQRCLERIKQVATNIHIYVIDSFSTDRTVDIAKKFGAIVIQRPWKNYADQFQFGMKQVPHDIDWVMRIDADEYISEDFLYDIQHKLLTLSNDVAGVYCGLRRIFLNKMIRFGLVNIRMLRLWRNGRGLMETRWMDEHIKLSGRAVNFRGYIIDHNLNNVGWWINKHNLYASREVVDVLMSKYSDNKNYSNLQITSPFGLKRFIKERIYNVMPCGVRSFLYFIWRYFIGLGFLDGFSGFAFHFLQGFWYRFLVDVKLTEVEIVMKRDGVDVKFAVQKVLDIEV